MPNSEETAVSVRDVITRVLDDCGPAPGWEELPERAARLAATAPAPPRPLVRGSLVILVVVLAAAAGAVAVKQDRGGEDVRAGESERPTATTPTSAAPVAIGSRSAPAWRTLQAPPVPAADGRAAVWTPAGVFLWGGPDNSAVLDADGTWQATAPPPVRTTSQPVVAWTGREVVVIGTAGAGAYDVAGDVWRPLATPPRSLAVGPVAVWTGREVVVWGGTRASGSPVSDGMALDVTTGRWRDIAASPLTPRAHATGVWSGRSVLVYGGQRENNEGLVDGAAYDPASDTWIPLPRSPLPPLYRHAAAYGGGAMFVWGEEQGTGGGRVVGAAYIAGEQRWRSLPDAGLRLAPAAEANTGVAGVWAEDEFVVWTGGLTGDQAQAFAYDPVRDAWRSLGTAPGPAHRWPTLVWTGAEVAAFGDAPPPVAVRTRR